MKTILEVVTDKPLTFVKKRAFKRYKRISQNYKKFWKGTGNGT